MITLAKREELCQKYNINPNDIKYTPYSITDEYNYINIIGVELEIVSLKISVKCHMSKSMIFNFKRCLKMVRCILDKYDNKL
jgi:hypothetical protein